MRTTGLRLAQWPRCAACLLLIAACGGGDHPSGAAAVPEGGAPDAGAGPSDMPPPPPHTGEDPPPEVDPPSFACGAHAPAALLSQCGACHALSGPPDPRYPDLYAFEGSEAEFIAKVRAGGERMPAFPSASIDDAALREAYAFLTGSAPAERPAIDLGSVVPLFAGAADPLPITFERDDGVLITRGAGRVRQRHELEGTYNPFGPHYFEDRTYGFVIEDYTPRGESRLRVTYLPIAMPTDNTNFRAFKIYGDGNVFHANTGMDSDTGLPSLARAGGDLRARYADEVAPFARIQTHEVTNNPREGRPLAAGDLFEFEFGIFIEPGAVEPGSRTSYYTDTFRYRLGTGGLTPDNADHSGTLGPARAAQLGGATTIAWIYAEPETYFSQMALNIQHEHVQGFVEGRRLFHTDFATGAHSENGNPALEAQAGKLGPLFVTTACVRCHEGNGGGRSLAGELGEDSSMVFKLPASENLGPQLSLQQGSASVLRREDSESLLGDGTAVVRTRPIFALRAQDREVTAYSPRIARRLVGLGLLEAIDEQTLLARADPDDCDGDGISGRPSLIADPEGAGLRIGRFGWKAEKVSVEHQVADALAADLGVHTRIIPGDGGEIELDDADLARLTLYMRLLGVPPQRDAEDPEVQHGELLFRSIGCANCHLPDVTTGDAHPFLELTGQPIRPYSDLLLHDLGPELADATQPGSDAAQASEWRTPPLWGLGLSMEVQGHVSLLHDGRADSVLEAVLWHGGEAEAVRQRFAQLSSADRASLLRFVESL